MVCDDGISSIDVQLCKIIHLCLDKKNNELCSQIDKLLEVHKRKVEYFHDEKKDFSFMLSRFIIVNKQDNGNMNHIHIQEC